MDPAPDIELHVVSNAIHSPSPAPDLQNSSSSLSRQSSVTSLPASFSHSPSTLSHGSTSSLTSAEAKHARKIWLRSLKAISAILVPAWTVYLALIGSHLDTVDDFYHEHLGVIITFWSSVVLSLTLCYKVFWRMRHVWCLHLFTDVLRGEGILVHFDTTEPRFQGGVLDSMILSWCFIAVIMLLVGGNTVAAFAVILQYAFTMRYAIEGMLQPPHATLPMEHQRSVVIVSEGVVRKAVDGFRNREKEEFTGENFASAVMALNGRRGAVVDNGESERVTRRWGMNRFEKEWTSELYVEVLKMNKEQCKYECWKLGRWNKEKWVAKDGMGSLHSRILEEVESPVQLCCGLCNFLSNGQIIMAICFAVSRFAYLIDGG